MKNLIKITTNDDKEALFNLDNVSYVFETNNNTINICFLNENDYLQLNMKLEDFNKKLSESGYLIYKIN